MPGIFIFWPGIAQTDQAKQSYTPNLSIPQELMLKLIVYLMYSLLSWKFLFGNKKYHNVIIKNVTFLNK